MGDIGFRLACHLCQLVNIRSMSWTFFSSSSAPPCQTVEQRGHFGQGCWMKLESPVRFLLVGFVEVQSSCELRSP